MAELSLSWLRLGQRPRAPTNPRSSAAPSDRLSMADTPGDHKTSGRNAPSRASSYLSLPGRFCSTPEPLSRARMVGSLVNEEDKIWHNPSLDQMVEALRVRLMTYGVSEPLPVDQNAFVLHLVEGFENSKEQLEKCRQSCDEATRTGDQRLEDFKIVSEEWVRREKQYKAEIKRLEVLLVRHSQDGLETVTLARKKSLVDRDEPDPRQFVSRLNEIRLEALKDGGNSDVFDLQADTPVFMGATPASDASAARLLDQIEKARPSKFTVSCVESNRLLLPIISTREEYMLSEKFRREDAIAEANNQQKHRRKHTPQQQTLSYLHEQETKYQAQPQEKTTKQLTEPKNSEQTQFTSSSSSAYSSSSSEDDQLMIHGRVQRHGPLRHDVQDCYHPNNNSIHHIRAATDGAKVVDAKISPSDNSHGWIAESERSRARRSLERPRRSPEPNGADPLYPNDIQPNRFSFAPGDDGDILGGFSSGAGGKPCCALPLFKARTLESPCGGESHRSELDFYERRCASPTYKLQRPSGNPSLTSKESIDTVEMVVPFPTDDVETPAENCARIKRDGSVSVNAASHDSSQRLVSPCRNGV